jgi:hypothetical protein
MINPACSRSWRRLSVSCHHRTVARAKLEWTTTTHLDGDEGPSKDYNWETIPDYTG